MPGKSAIMASGPPIDFTAPEKGVDVKVELAKKQTAKALRSTTPLGGGPTRAGTRSFMSLMQ